MSYHAQIGICDKNVFKQNPFWRKGKKKRLCGIKSILGLSYTTDWKKTTCWNCRRILIKQGFIGLNYEPIAEYEAKQ